MVSPPLLDRFAADPPDSQEASPFFRLPREIRLMIYSLAWRSFGDRDNLHLHITTQNALACHSARSPWDMMAIPCWRPPPMEDADGEDEISYPPDTDYDPVAEESALPELERSLQAMRMNNNGDNVDNDSDDADEGDDYDTPRSADKEIAAHPEMNTRGVRLFCRRIRQNHVPWMTHAVCGHNYSRLQGWSFTEDRKRRQAKRTAAAAAATGYGRPSAPVENALSAPYYNRRPHLYRPFLPVLLTCKRIYVEAVESLYNSLIFQFTSVDTANDFLARWPCVRSLNILVDLPEKLMQLYMPWPSLPDMPGAERWLKREGQGEGQGEGHGEGQGEGEAGEIADTDADSDSSEPSQNIATIDSNPWQKLSANLASLSNNTDTNPKTPQLRYLRVWVKGSDKRPWSECAPETRLMTDLLETRVAGGRHNFILCLPDLAEPDPEPEPEPENPPLFHIPSRRKRKRRPLKGYYLDEDAGPGASPDNGDLPCTVRRSSRISIYSTYAHLINLT